MGKYGKWIGGGLGWVLGGPIGALLGFAFGSVVDGMQSGTYAAQNSGSGTHPGPTSGGDFAVSLVVLSAAIMKADGKVVKSELDYVKSFFIKQFGINKSEQYILLLRDILQQEINLYEVCAQVRTNMDYSGRLQLLHYLFGIALSDGAGHQKEIDAIEIAAQYLGISAAEFRSLKAMFVKDATSAYKILEIEPTASDDEVKKAYRKMAVKYHPDKVSHLGEEVQHAAKEKFQQLNQAYESIKKERGLV
ncbi:MAG: TerB family tellurite resistance protein [Bacteroidales bacterium]|nr:TerB family tellurite resistance protein [Bacteroidales bacterium]MDD3961655.1 TerB family tellurite resistance protein [Bacteroidales bacterium]MDY0286010.1 TerB family tellurite resistance protein [Bacteroidales bacterium]HPE87006.1 TerB family tellurite resistance protein [Bacteroidales bacterium]